MKSKICDSQLAILKAAGSPQRKTIQRMIKRCLDFSSAILLLIILSPLMALIAILIKLTSRGPIFFLQDRLGYRGSTFRIIKFRTMVDKAWEKGTGLYVTEGDARITPLGRILRLAHLDELPQLINVIKGEMSFVGPRPTIPFQYDYYEDWEKARVEVRPGITGWSQVNFANAINWDERIKLDVYYAHNWSLWLDMYIIIRTAMHMVACLFGKSEIYPKRGPVWTRGRPDDIRPQREEESE